MLQSLDACSDMFRLSVILDLDIHLVCGHIMCLKLGVQIQAIDNCSTKKKTSNDSAAETTVAQPSKNSIARHATSNNCDVPVLPSR